MAVSRKQKSSQNQLKIQGFTLVELLATIAIMGILIGVIIGTMGFATRKSDLSKARSQIARIQFGLEKYKAQWGMYPRISAWTNQAPATALQGNTNLVWILYKQPSQYTAAKVVYAEFKESEISGNGAILDPWGNLYYYNGLNPTQNPDSYDIMSKGPDPIDPLDDITNWRSQW